MKDLVPHPSAFRSQANGLVDWAMTLIINDRVFLSAICCLSAQHFQSSTDRVTSLLFPSIFSSYIPRLILKFKYQTIFNLNRRLKGPIGKIEAGATLYSIMALMAVEVRISLYLS
jgi:hypothetical protein